MNAQRIIAALALCALSLSPTRPAAADASLRHLEYRVTVAVDGMREARTVRADILRVTDDRGMTVEVDESMPGDERREFVDLDRYGSVIEHGAPALTREESVMLYFLSLSAQNLTGMSRGDEWKAGGDVPGGRQETRYIVLRSDDDGRIDLSVSRTIALTRETSSWRGIVQFDYKTIVPRKISLSGRVRTRDTERLRVSDIKLTVLLTADSFSSS